MGHRAQTLTRFQHADNMFYLKQILKTQWYPTQEEKRPIKNTTLLYLSGWESSKLHIQAIKDLLELSLAFSSEKLHSYECLPFECEIIQDTVSWVYLQLSKRVKVFSRVSNF